MPQERMISVTIPGDPVAQGRGRAVRTGKGVRVIDPKKSRSWKGAAQVHMLAAMKGKTPLPGPVSATIKAYWPCRGPRKRTPRPAYMRPKRPDADNIAKAVLDAAQGILFHDDGQVVDLRVQKWYAAQGDTARVEVTVEEVLS